MTISRLRCEVVQGAIPPVISQSDAREKLIVDEGVDRKQLDGCDTKLPEVVNAGVVGESQPGPPDGFRNRGIADTETLGMQFVNAVSYTHLRAHETVLDLVCR